MRRLTGPVLQLVVLTLAGVFAIGAFSVVKNLGWLSPLGIESETRDTQVIRAMKRTQEISLLSLGIQGLLEEKKTRDVFGVDIPGSGETVFLQYAFTAKLGVDGDEVSVTRTGENAYRISVPEFVFIGYDEPTFKVAVEDGSVLSWITPDIDKVEMVNKILNDDARETYLEDHREVLEEQTKVFYDSLIKSIDPAIVATYAFR